MLTNPDAIYPIIKSDIDKLQSKISSNYYLNKYGQPLTKYGYRNDGDEIQFIVVQFETGSCVFYLYKTRTGGAREWSHGIPPNIRPINLFNVNKRPAECNNVFIVNTEKQALTKIDGWHGVAWAGNCEKTINFSNWKSLINVENILIWTDRKSGTRLKSRLPHAKIINNEDFDGSDNHLAVFKKAMEFKELGIPEADPFLFYKLFIHEFYGDECMEQRNGSFWRYRKTAHHWKIEEMKDIRANFQTWFSEPRTANGAALIDYVQAEGLAINKFINNALEFVTRHASGRIYDNPFKDSAISPYIHLQNGLIHISKTQKMTEWKDRTDDNENFFRKKYPVHCCEYEFNEKYLHKVSIDSAPTFKYIIDGFIPTDIKLTKSERQKTREFFAQIIAYSISPIKPTEYFFGLYGNEGTGKSFFVDVIKDIIGENFFLERPIDEMTLNNRFASSDFWGSKVYVEPDMKTKSLLPEAFIKTFCGQKQVTLEKKQRQPDRGVNISIAMFFISNFDFITKGMEGLARRVIYIPFKNMIKKPDRSLRDKIKGKVKKGKESGKAAGRQFDERPIILALAMHGWRTFLKNGAAFTMPEWIIEAKDEWIKKSDTVRGFINEVFFDVGEWRSIYRKDLYNDYQEWCKEEADKKPYGKSKFYEEVNRMKKVKSKVINGKRCYEFFPDQRPAEYVDNFTPVSGEDSEQPF